MCSKIQYFQNIAILRKLGCILSTFLNLWIILWLWFVKNLMNFFLLFATANSTYFWNASENKTSRISKGFWQSFRTRGFNISKDSRKFVCLISDNFSIKNRKKIPHSLKKNCSNHQNHMSYSKMFMEAEKKFCKTLLRFKKLFLQSKWWKCPENIIKWNVSLIKTNKSC